MPAPCSFESTDSICGDWKIFEIGSPGRASHDWRVEAVFGSEYTSNIEKQLPRVAQVGFVMFRGLDLTLIHFSESTRAYLISYAVLCLIKSI